MKYRDIKIDGFLSNFINRFWEYDNSQNEVEFTILPDGYFDLIFEIQNNEILNISLTGIWTKQINVKIQEHTKLIGIQFKLIASEYIFQESIKLFINSETILPADFWGAKSLPLDNLEKFTTSLSQKINYGLKNLKEIDNRKFKLFNTLYEQKGTISVKKISENVSWNSRQINRYFNQQFGFPLKTFSNILKCKSSYRDIAEGQLSPTQDYYDQAHYIKEVKRYTGNSPKELYRNENDRFLQLSTLGEK
jgi:AraC-like DNA-binding protein